MTSDKALGVSKMIDTYDKLEAKIESLNIAAGRSKEWRGNLGGILLSDDQKKQFAEFNTLVEMYESQAEQIKKISGKAPGDFSSAAWKKWADDLATKEGKEGGKEPPPPADTTLSDAAQEKIKTDHDKLLADLAASTKAYNDSGMDEIARLEDERAALEARVNADTVKGKQWQKEQLAQIDTNYIELNRAALEKIDANEIEKWNQETARLEQAAASKKQWMEQQQVAWEQATMTQESAQMAALARERQAAIDQMEALKLIGQEKADALAKIDEAYEANKEALRKTAAEKTLASQKAYSSAIMDSMVGVAGAFSGGMKAIVGSSKKHAKELKALAIFESMVNGARAVMIALTGTPFPWINAVNVGAAIATTATQIGTISAAKYERGGLPAGHNALIQVNEKGQEAVLNARATNLLGAGGVNALNNGSTISQRNVAEIHYSPTYHITGGASSSMRDTFKQDADWFSKFIFQEMKKRGYASA